MKRALILIFVITGMVITKGELMAQFENFIVKNHESVGSDYMKSPAFHLNIETVKLSEDQPEFSPGLVSETAFKSDQISRQLNLMYLNHNGLNYTLNSFYGEIAGSEFTGLIQPESHLYSIPKELNIKVEAKGMSNIIKPVYKIKAAIDVPIVTVGTGWSLFAFTKIYKKGRSSEEKILSLKKSNINAFDRGFIYPYSESLNRISYYFYAVVPLPLVLFATQNEMRKDYLKLSFLYWEAMSISGMFGTGTTYLVDRYRPYAYDSKTSLEQRESQIAKNSFNSGHVELVAVSTFFLAKVYSDYNPDSNIKWVFYSFASAATAATAYLRLKAGQHFPTDILYGGTLGVLTGLLVPQTHKNKTPALSVFPYGDGEVKGLALIYNIQGNRRRVSSSVKNTSLNRKIIPQEPER